MDSKKTKDNKVQSSSMVAEHPLKKDEKKKDEKQENEKQEEVKEKKIEDFKKEVLDWEFAGVCQFKGWMSGKVVSDKEFKEALEKFKSRKQGEIEKEK